MKRVERHIIGKNHRFFKEIDHLSFLSKNVYNASNYLIRQKFINTSKEKESGLRDSAIWLRQPQIQKLMQSEKNVDYYALPTKVSVQILRLLDHNWKSFFVSIKDWKKNPNKYKAKPNLPQYKNKTNGRQAIIYNIQSVSRKKLKKGIISLSGTNIKFTTKQKHIKEVRILPKQKSYVIEVVYEKEITDLNLNKNNIAAIDTGINNIGTVTSNQGIKPIVINGRTIKSINQYYNKMRAKYQSYIGTKGVSNRLIDLTNKRNNKINDALHKVSRFIVNHLIQNDIGTLVIGYNKEWKQNVNIGKRNNQNFDSVPIKRFIDMITYKFEDVGGNVILNEESYTSKCSFLDNEEIKKHRVYKGKRIKRGMFQSSNETFINADCNGSGNILRKVFPTAFNNAYGIEGVAVRPIRVHPYKCILQE